MPRPLEVYLDIETDWNRNLTVVGFTSSDSGTVQLVGEEITLGRLRRWLPRAGRMYTYNGHCFDLPCIRAQLGIDLRSRLQSWDLRWICRRAGLRGSQKAIEQRIRFKRMLKGIDGSEAIRLWDSYCSGNENDLNTLLKYNREDLQGMRAIKQHSSALGRLYLS